MELRGKTILITRAAAQSEELRTGLEAAGARVIECPAIEIVPVSDWTEVDRVAAGLEGYDWLILTSANAVTHFMQRLRTLGINNPVPIAAIGTGTAARLAEWNLKASRIPRDFRAEGLLELFEPDLGGVRILIPRAETAREILPNELRRRGATVDVVAIYRTVKPSASLARLADELAAKTIDAVVFTSPSAVRNVVEVLGESLASGLGTIPIAAIGPIAQEAVEAAGLRAAIVPARATIQDLIDEVCSYFSNPARGT
jgi:uroporphyrinogen III methyltransferase / synthase